MPLRLSLSSTLHCALAVNLKPSKAITLTNQFASLLILEDTLLFSSSPPSLQQLLNPSKHNELSDPTIGLVWGSTRLRSVGSTETRRFCFFGHFKHCPDVRAVC